MGFTGIRPSLGTIALGFNTVDNYEIGASEAFSPFGPSGTLIFPSANSGDVFRLTRPIADGRPFTIGVNAGYVSGMDIAFAAFFAGQTFASMGITPLPVVTTFGNNTVNLSFQSAVVPLPAALPLMLAGLGGLGLASRRKMVTA